MTPRRWLVLVVLLVLGLSFFVDANRFRPMLESQLSGVLAREVRVGDLKLTLQFYSHAVSQDRMAAAGEMLTAILSHESGLRAD